jgi:hypothetical protein
MRETVGRSTASPFIIIFINSIKNPEGIFCERCFGLSKKRKDALDRVFDDMPVSEFFRSVPTIENEGPSSRFYYKGA